MKLKKLLSLVVTIVFIFSMVTITNVQAAENEFAILNKIGIKIDFSDKTTLITKYQLAEFLFEYKNLSIDPEGEPTYTDIPVNHKFFPVVNAVTKAGLISARSDGSFGVDAYATDIDGARLILSELGYNAFGQQAGWTDAQYTSKIQMLSLLKGVDTSNSLTYYDLGKMFMNMLTSKVMEIVSITPEGIKYKESDKTYLEYYHGYVSQIGVFEAFENASISGRAQVAKNRAVIDGVIYKTNGDDFSSFVGCTVKYILTSPYPDSEIIYINKVQPTNELVIDAEDILNYSNYSLKYIDEDGKQDTITFSPSTRVIINGQNMVEYFPEYFTPKKGSITFVDTNGDETYDLINIEYKIFFKVGAVSTGKLVNAYTAESILTDDYRTYSFADGKAVPLTSYLIGDYVEVAPGVLSFEYDGDGNQVVNVDYSASKTMLLNKVSTTNLSGKISGKRTGGIAIDGVFYEYDNYTSSLMSLRYITNPAIGADVTVVLDNNGKILDILDIKTSYAEVTDSLTYGYMLTMRPDRKNEKGAYIRMIDIFKLEEKLYKTAPDCKFNGNEFDFTKISAVNPETTATSIYWPDGSDKDQLIKYSLNANGEINNVYIFSDFSNQYLMTGYGTYSDTLKNPDFDSKYDGYNERYFTLDSSKTMSGFGEILNMLYSFVQGKTLQLIIPNDPTQLDFWTVYNNVPIKDNKTIIDGNNAMAYELYDCSESYVPSVAIRRSASAGGGSIAWSAGYYRHDDRSMFVTDIQTVYDEIDNVEKREITGYKVAPGGGVTKYSYIPTDNNMVARAELCLNDMTGDTPVNYGSYHYTWQDIQIGDIIRIKEDMSGRAAWFGVQIKAATIDDINNLDYGPLAYQYSGRRNYYSHYDLGYVTKVFPTENLAIMNTEGPGGSADGLFKILKPRTVSSGSTTVGGTMLIHTKSKKVEAADITDLKVGDSAIVFTTFGSVNELIILRE